MAAETVELHKLKLAELKQECLARGLETKGNKQDLINRLQTYLEQHAEEEANEEDVLGEETEVNNEIPFALCFCHCNGRGGFAFASSSTAALLLALPVCWLFLEEEPKPIDTPIKEEITTEKSAEVGAEKKVVKITSEMPQMERMQKRAERFNVPVSLESKKAARAARFGMTTASTKGLIAESKTTVNLDKLKERAQRFGLNASTVSKKVRFQGKQYYGK
ncbi:SAP domain-containing ribonucleoprotein [Varanus komodoensis]|nr:SAP domain-containing ribonucleoprotein [Varanus komodoensis]